jgi:hypothetical protein
MNLAHKVLLYLPNFKHNKNLQTELRDKMYRQDHKYDLSPLSHVHFM